MSMEQRFEPDVMLEAQVEQLQADVGAIRADLDRATKWITGNGDPTQGLLWVAADLGRLVAAATDLAGAQAAALERHRADEHGNRRGGGFKERFAYDVAKQVATVLVVVFLVLLWVGFENRPPPPGITP